MSDEVKRVLLSRLMYCQNQNKYCRAGGLANSPVNMHPNYGLPCIGGTITYQDGTEVISPRCIFCGSSGSV